MHGIDNQNEKVHKTQAHKKQTKWPKCKQLNIIQLECGPMPNDMVALLNTGGALCSMPQSLADAHYLTAVQYRCQDPKAVEISWGARNYRTDLSR